jgi:hypothetical protein
MAGNSPKPAPANSKDVLKVYKIDAYMTFVGSAEEYALSAFGAGYVINGVPTAQIRPAFGQNLFGSKRKVEETIGANIGKTIEIHFKLNGKRYVVFTGIISSFSVSKGNSGNSSSMAVTYNAVGMLIQLAALPPASRIIMAPKDIVSTVDSYTRAMNQALAGVPFKDPKSLNEIAQIVGLEFTGNPAEGIVNLITYFYMMEGLAKASEGQGAPTETQRKKQTEAIEYINTFIRPNIADMHFVPELTQGYSEETLKFLDSISTQWPNNTGLQVLMSHIGRIYGVLVPTAYNTHIIPDTAGLKTPVAVIKSAQIFGNNWNKAVEPVPFAGIAMAVPIVNDDKLLPSPYSWEYISWPKSDVDTPGMYAWATPPPWFQLYRRLKLQEDAEAELVKQKNNQDSKSTVTSKMQDKSALDKEREWLLIFAKAEYGNRIWAKEQITISTDYISDIAPGNLIRIFPENSTNEKDSIIGLVRAVSLECSVGVFKQTFIIGNVRTHADNERMAFDSHQLFTEYKQKCIPLFKVA